MTNVDARAHCELKDRFAFVLHTYIEVLVILHLNVSEYNGIIC